MLYLNRVNYKKSGFSKTELVAVFVTTLFSKTESVVDEVLREK